jgi:hypothetical protein
MDSITSSGEVQTKAFPCPVVQPPLLVAGLERFSTGQLEPSQLGDQQRAGRLEELWA